MSWGVGVLRIWGVRDTWVHKGLRVQGFQAWRVRPLGHIQATVIIVGQLVPTSGSSPVSTTGVQTSAVTNPRGRLVNASTLDRPSKFTTSWLALCLGICWHLPEDIDD